MPILDDAWFRAWIIDPNGERAFLTDLLQASPYLRRWMTCANFKARNQEKIGRTTPARFSLLRLPRELAGWSAFVLWRVLQYACRFHPAFQIMLKDHLYTELLLYAESDFANYREHIVHPYKVMAIGAWLMDNIGRLIPQISTRLKSNARVLQLVKDLHLAESVLDDHRLIKTAWWLAGLFHDIGYTFYFMSNNLEPRILRTYPVYVGSAGGRLGVGTPLYLAQMALFRDLWESSNPDVGHRGFLTESASMNHSVVGGLTLLSMLGEMESIFAVRPEQALAVHLAADAIALHDLIGSKKAAYCGLPRKCLLFRDRPLAWLLVLCDELQDWGRPRLKFVRNGMNKVDTTFDVSRSSIQCNIIPLAAGPNLAEIQLDADTLNNLNSKAVRTLDINISWSPPILLSLI
jgi:hypothetical protein